MTKVKIIVIGDGGVGKTSILVTYSTDAFPTKHVPTVFDNYEDDISVDGKSVRMELWDTAGQEEYDRLRPICYKNCDVFVVCYSIRDRSTLEHIKGKWIPEIHKYQPGVPWILVGTKADLREGADAEDYVAIETAKNLGTELGASEFLECSAKTQAGLKDVMIQATRIGLTQNRSRKKCVLL